MANNHPPARPPPDVVADDFLEQLLSMSAYGGGAPPALTHHHVVPSGGGNASVAGGLPAAVFPLALRVEDEQRAGAASRSEGTPAVNLTNRDPIQLSSLLPGLGAMQSNPSGRNYVEVSHGQAIQSAFTAMPHMQAARPKVRARRGQATDPHSIAERLRRERIAERFRALQELLPNTNKTDRAAMLDEILDYVKFLRLQVKILSMSRLGGAGTMAHLLADIPLLSLESKSADGVKNQFWEKWTNDGTEHQVAKLMEEDIGAAMQFLQSKALCVMPISVASAIYSPQDKPKDFEVELDQRAPS